MEQKSHLDDKKGQKTFVKMTTKKRVDDDDDDDDDLLSLS